MPETPASLLECLRLSPDEKSWQELVQLCSPWLKQWLHRYEVPPADAEDLIQEVLQVVFREISSFQHNGRKGAFRNWLKKILIHRSRAFWKSRDASPVAIGGSDFLVVLEELEDPKSLLSEQWDLEHDRVVARYLLEKLRARIQPSSWQAFEATVIQGLPAAEAADRLQMTVNAVLCAKSRALRALRQAAKGLID